jgi:hypothetical protein
MSSIFNTDAWKKAVQTYKSKSPTPSVPSTPIGALAGVSQPAPQPTPATLPPAAIQAASNVRSGKMSVPTVPESAKVAAQKMVTRTSQQPRTEQALSAQADLVNTPFSYDPTSDPAYQAALRAAQQTLEVNQKNTNAQLRATGQGKSSYSETVANQLANQSSENIANNVLPVYAQQAYQQYQDSIGNQRNLYSDYNQQDFQNPITESSVTGNYMPAEATAAYKQLIANKQAAESPTITRDERAAISSETDALRATLKRLGIDISGLGADKTSAQAGAVNPGIRTLAGQNQDLAASNQTFNQKLSTRQQDFNEGITMADLTGSINGKATTAEQQRQLTNLWTVAEQTGTIPDTLADQYGIPRGTQTQSAKQLAAQIANDVRGLDISQQNADTSQANASSSITGNTFNRYLDIWKATGTAPSGLEAYGVEAGSPWYEGAQNIKEGGLTVNQVIDNVKSLYQEPITRKEIDPSTLKMIETDTGKTKITSDPAQRKKMFDNVVDSGLGNNETLQALNSLGFTKAEIQKFYDEGIQSSGE